MKHLSRYCSPREWTRHILKGAIHAGSGALLATAGTHTIEALSPEMLKAYTQGVGLGLGQAISVFLAAGWWECLKRVHQATADTNHPFSEVCSTPPTDVSHP